MSECPGAEIASRVDEARPAILCLQPGVEVPPPDDRATGSNANTSPNADVPHDPLYPDTDTNTSTNSLPVAFLMRGAPGRNTLNRTRLLYIKALSVSQGLKKKKELRSVAVAPDQAN